MGCGASATAGSRGTNHAPKPVNPTKAIQDLREEFDGIDAWGFEKASIPRESSIEGSDSSWSLNERTLAKKYGLEWLQKRRKVEQFLHSMQGYGVSFTTVVACIQLFQEGAGWPHKTPSLTESLFIKCVLFTEARPTFCLTAFPSKQAYLRLNKDFILVSENLPVLQFESR